MNEGHDLSGTWYLRNNLKARSSKKSFQWGEMKF